MTAVIVTLNAGSSSIKFATFSIYGDALNPEPEFKGQIAGIDGDPFMEITVGKDQSRKEQLCKEIAGDHGIALDYLLNTIDERLGTYQLSGVGHRVVHGGAKFSAPQILTNETITQLEKFIPLAPGHQPHNLNGVKAAQKRWPEARQVACFDTAFHRTQTRAAEQFALPYMMTEEGIIRYGFHGLSYEYIASVAPEIMGDAPHQRMIVAHLGAGASMCALMDGKSVATTMGFTALDGLPMGTRCGDIDPGVLLYLLQEKGMSASELADCLYEKSGLLGMSGISSDMRILQESDDPRAIGAIDYFVHRTVREIGSLAAALGGVDALVFTAGIGENSSFIRKKILTGCRWLGFEVDDHANATNVGCITLNDNGPSGWVIRTNEELVIAQHTFHIDEPV